MATTSPKEYVRLVRCPKCSLLLPEFAHVPVYSCGGCNTILVAKNRSITHDADAQITPLSQQQQQQHPGQPNHLQPSTATATTSSHPNQQHIVTSSLPSTDDDNDDDVSSTDAHSSPQPQPQPAAAIDIGNQQHSYSSTQPPHSQPVGETTSLAADVVIPTSDPSGSRLDYFPKSATLRRSFRAYDASISSYDGDGDGDGDVDGDGIDDNNSLVSSIRSRNSSELLTKNPNATDYHTPRGPKQPGQQFTDNHGASFRKGKRLAAYDHHLSESEAPFYQNATLAGYDSSASTSSQLHHHQLPRNSTQQQEERMKLLRMVNELHSALNKTCNLNASSISRPTVEASWNENQFPRYYDSEATSGELIRSRNLGRTRQRSVCVHQSRFSRTTFSGDALNSDPSCLYCHPQDWQRSVQLRPSMFQGGHNMNHNHNHHPGYSNCFSSCPASPQRNMESDFLPRKSSDQRYRDNEQLRKRLREKRMREKRHVRPTAGGAPFVACYSCLKLLQLPADFLLFKKTRRVHQLKCGACLKELKFSLNGGTRIVPYEPALVVPPPSEVSGVKASSSRPDPVSISEDYGLCSTDMDTSENRIKNSVEEIYSPSSIMSSEMEKQQKTTTRRATSPLHRLMGYSSASEVIRGS